ncbi:MAG: beta-glucosidase BglX [Candidatus Marinimicrobia bacterium]|nr:beta-glucosidase BglX [Candidatus Neomarinimicrobiota bacterium]
MIRIRLILIATIIAFVISNYLFGQQDLTNSEIEEKVNLLLSEMTLEEKIGQMVQYSGTSPKYEQMIREEKVGSFLNIRGATEANRLQRIAVEETKLGIPLIFGNDVIHGYRTIFPIPLAEAASWDPDLVEKAASIAAKEAASGGTHWTFAPMVDIARDPRWGRIAEGSGEDPYLGSVMARAKVLGFQGDELADPFTILACPKHFVAYGGAEGGKDYNTVDISERTLREIYLPPFKAAVGAGAGSIMSAFNEISGIPASANELTLTDILRGEWGFNGFVVSDWNSIGELVSHGIAADPYEAGYKALKAGVDMDMMGNVYLISLSELVNEEEIHEESINDAVRRILRYKYRLGLFEHPYINPDCTKDVILNEKHLDTALKLARESIVLLKNEKKILPLKKDLNAIAVIGPLANDREAPLGSWACEGKSKDIIPVLEGIKNKVSSKTKVLYAKGCKVEGGNRKGIQKAIKIAKKAKVVIIVVGENADMSGEAASRAFLDLPGIQVELVKAVYETGIPVVVVLMNGRPLAIPWIVENVPAILESWFLGVQCGNAVADVLFGDYNPGGKLPVTFPRSVGQVPIYYNHKNTGRPLNKFSKYTSKYIDLPSSPQFPFGYGLSYTKFNYSNLRINSGKISLSDSLVVEVEVKNHGDRTGDEVVQLYIHDLVASVTRPVKELKGFRRITLAPNENIKVKFVLHPEQLGFYNCEMEYITEPGKFEVMVGGNSVDLVKTTFEIEQSSN